MVIFLGLNGLEFRAGEEEVVAMMTTLAAGDLPEEELADWIRVRSGPAPSPPAASG